MDLKKENHEEKLFKNINVQILIMSMRLISKSRTQCKIKLNHKISKMLKKINPLFRKNLIE